MLAFVADDEVMRWTGGEAGGRETAIEVVERWIARWETNGVGQFAVVRDGRVIGRVGLLVWDARVLGNVVVCARGRERRHGARLGAHERPLRPRPRDRGGSGGASLGLRGTRYRAPDFLDRPEKRPLDPRSGQARCRSRAAGHDGPRPRARLAAPSRPVAGAIDVALELPAEQALEPHRRSRSARRGRCPSRRPRPRGDRRRPRSRRCPSRAARRGSRRARRSTHRARAPASSAARQFAYPVLRVLWP